MKPYTDPKWVYDMLLLGNQVEVTQERPELGSLWVARCNGRRGRVTASSRFYVTLSFNDGGGFTRMKLEVLKRLYRPAK